MDSSPKQAVSGLDPDLLARVARGDRGAFSQLYEHSSALLFSLAFRILGDREAAADLLQDVYLKVWRKRVRYDAERGSPMAWMVTMTRSRASDRLRSRTAKGHGVTDPIENLLAAQLAGVSPSPLEASAGNETRSLIGKALTELPEAQRKAIELAFYQGLSEAADLLPPGLPITVPPQELKDKIETAALAQVLTQAAGTNNPDATLRTPDVDVTIRTPNQPVIAPAGDVTVRLPNQPEVVPAGGVTVRLPNQPAAVPEFSARIRTPSQPAARAAPPVKAAPVQSSWWAWAATLAFATTSIALVLGIGIYAFSLKSKVTLEITQRQQAETALQQQTIQTATLRQELTQAQQELTESKQRLGTLTALQDTVAQREINFERLRTQLAQKEKELVALYKTVSPKDEMLAMLQSANVRVLALAGTNAAKLAGGLILYDPERGKAFLYAFNMPALQRGKVYQLWAITTKPVSAGTFIADTGRKSRYIARSLPAKSGITKFAVSVEPEGGKPQPTGAIYLHGSL